MKSLTAERVRELFNYEPDTGVFTRAKSVRGHLSGEVVGTEKDNGYLHFCIDYKKHGAHRIAWLHFYGEMPDKDIDHIDGNRRNNAIKNLRCVDRSTNLENRKRANTNNKSTGLLGAYKTKNNLFTSRIQVLGKDFYLGCFKSPEEANMAYLDAKRRMHVGNTI